MFRLYHTDYAQRKSDKKIQKAFKVMGKLYTPYTVSEFNASTAMQIDDHLGYFIAAEEFLLHQAGQPVLFLASKDSYSELLNADFILDEQAVVDMPFPCFSVSIPKGLKHNGIELKPFMVSFLSQRERADDYMKDFVELTKTSLIGDGTDPDDKQLTIAFKCDDGGCVRTTVRMQEIPKLLTSKSGVEFVDNVNKTSTATNLSLAGTTAEELELQFHSIKLALAIGVYHNAVGGLIEGYPLDKVSIPKGLNRTHFKAYRYSNEVSPSSVNTSASTPDAATVFKSVLFSDNKKPENDFKPKTCRWEMIKNIPIE